MTTFLNEESFFFQEAAEKELNRLIDIKNFYIQSINKEVENLRDAKEPEDFFDEITGNSSKENFEDYRIDRFEELYDIQQILNKTYIITLCMFIEKHLRIVCQTIQEKKSEIFSLNELQGNSGIDQCVRYVKKLTNIDLTVQVPDLSLLSTLRNIIIHNNGQLTTEKRNELINRCRTSNLEQFIKIENNSIIIESKSLDDFLKFFRISLLKLLNFTILYINRHHLYIFHSGVLISNLTTSSPTAFLNSRLVAQRAIPWSGRGECAPYLISPTSG
jgi:hypothetical protein